MGMFDFLNGNPLAGQQGGMAGLASNPLFAMGLQMMTNSAKQVGGSRPLFENAFQAMSGAQRNSAIAQSMKNAQQQADWQQQQQKWAEQDRNAHAASVAQINAALSGQNEYARDAGVTDLAMQSEPASTRAMGAPMPPNPLSPQSLLQPLLNDPQTYGAAVNSILSPKKPNYFTVGNTLLDESGRPIFTAPQNPTETQRDYNTAVQQGYKGLLMDYQRELKSMRAEERPFFQAVPITDENGNPSLAAFDARSGRLTPLSAPGGGTAIKSSDSVGLTRDKAGATAAGRLQGEAQAQARLDLPNVEAKTAYAINLLDSLKNHPGMSAAVGVPGVTNYLPGTDAAGFKAMLNQIKGGTFLEAFQQLKGGGAITEVEGQKAEQAIARMDTAQSEKDFKAALDDYKTVMQNGLTRLKSRAGMQGAGGANPGAPAGLQPGAIEGGYRFKGGNPADPNSWERAN